MYIAHTKSGLGLHSPKSLTTNTMVKTTLDQNIELTHKKSLKYHRNGIYPFRYIIHYYKYIFICIYAKKCPIKSTLPNIKIFAPKYIIKRLFIFPRN